MKILVGRNYTPVEFVSETEVRDAPYQVIDLTLFKDGCCYEIKPVIMGYDVSNAHGEVSYSDLTAIMQTQLVVEDSDGRKSYFDPDVFAIIDFDPILYEAAVEEPKRYMVSGSTIVLNPNFIEDTVTIGNDDNGHHSGQVN